MEEIELTFYAEKRADGWYVRMRVRAIPDRFEGSDADIPTIRPLFCVKRKLYLFHAPHLTL